MKNKIKYGNILQFSTEDTQTATFKGSIYRKQIAKFGAWENPDYPWFSDDPKMTLDVAWAEQIKENFDNENLGSLVPVPLNHSDDVQVNTGLVQSLEIVEGDGLYANLKIIDENTQAKLDNGLIFDVSISFVWDLVRQDNGKHYGPTLLHVALVNTPYLIGMTSFEKVGQALSKLSKSFKPVGLSLYNESAIMLSRTKIKELSKMEDSILKNEKDFDVTVTYKNGDEDVEVVVKAGEEVTVPTDVAEDVTTQLAEAEAEAPVVVADEEEVAPVVTPVVEDEEEDDKTALAKANLSIATLTVEKRYGELLSNGKVTPSQKDRILGLAKLSAGVNLSTEAGKKIDLATVVFDILEAGSVKFSTEENGSGAEAPVTPEVPVVEDDKKPSETLTEAELAGFKAVGADVSKMDEMAASDPIFREALKSLSKKYEKKGNK